MRRTAALLLASTAFTTSNVAADASPKWSPWADAGAFYNNRDDGRGELTLWAPLDQTADSVLFLDVRGKLFDAGEREGNIAFGYREQHDGWNLGLWAGFDLRHSALDSTFPQISGGVEALSADWDIRVNGYLLIDDSDLISTATTTGPATPTILLNGNSILMQTATSTTTSTITELAFGGFDAEIGVRAPLELLDLYAKKFDLRLYGGGFYFDNNDAPESISGPKARLELRINDIIDALPGSRLTLEAEYTDDDVRGDRSEFGLRLRVPLGDTPALTTATPQDARMTEGLRRDTDVVASAKTTSSTVLSAITTEAVKDAATQVVLSRVAYIDGTNAAGLGTLAFSQGANTLIIAQGGNGAIGANTLRPNQTLVGGGGILTLQGVTSAATVQFVAPGLQPTILMSTAPLFLFTNDHVTGLSIDATQATTLPLYIPSGFSTTNVVIDHNSAIGQSSIHALSATDADQVTIADNTFSGFSFGVSLADVSNARITNNSISATFTGVLVSSATTLTYSNITIDGNTIVTPQVSPNAGVLVSTQGQASQLNITNNTVTAYIPIFVRSDGSSGVISGNSLNAANGAWALDFEGINNVFTGSGNTSTNPAATACFANPNPASNVQFVGGGTCP